VVHVPASRWGDGGAVRWFANALGGADQAVALPCMLELLTVLPQEARQTRAAVHPDRRDAFADEMRAAVPDALTVLVSCAPILGERMREHLLVAYGAWIRLSADRGCPGLDGTALVEHPLTAVAVSGLAEPDTFEAAVNALIELLWCTSQEGRPRESMLPLAMLVVRKAAELRPRFAICVRRAGAERGAVASAGAEGVETPSGPDVHGYDDDDDMARHMARLFSEIGEAYLDLIAEGSDDMMDSVRALLEVAAHPDYETAAACFEFWRKLSYRMTDLRKQPGPDTQRVLDMYSPLFSRLILLIQGRVRYPIDFDDLSSQERRDWKRNRYHVGDTLDDAARVVRAEEALKLLVGPLRDLSVVVAAGGEFDWRAAEAALYCIRCVREEGCRAPPAQLLELFSVLPQMPKVGLLQYTVSLVIQGYADWIAGPEAAAADPGLVEAALKLVSDGLSVPEAAVAAAQGFYHLCDALTKSTEWAAAEGRPGSVVDVGRLVTFALDVVRGTAECGDAGRMGATPPALALTEIDVHQILKGATVMTRALSEDRAAEAVRVLLAPLLQGLAGAVAATDSASLDSPNQRLTFAMVNRVSTVVRNVSSRDATRVVLTGALESAWPSLVRALEVFKDDADRVESVCRVLRYGVKTLGVAARSLMPSFAVALPGFFVSQRHPCYVYLASELVKQFAPLGPEGVAAVRPLFLAMLGPALETLGTEDAVHHLPEVADDVFLLLNRALCYAPSLLLEPGALEAAVNTALLACHVQHRHALGSVCKFLQQTAHLPPQDAPPRNEAAAAARAAEANAHAALAADVFRRRLGPCVRRLLAGVVGAAPYPAVRELFVVEPIPAVVRLLRNEALEAIVAALRDVPDKSAPARDREAVVESARRVAALEPGDVSEHAGACMQAMVNDLVRLAEVTRRSPKLQHDAVAGLLNGGGAPPGGFPPPPPPPPQ